MAIKFRLGIDIGGTFTDATLINEETGEIHIVKIPSTPKDPSIGFLTAVDRMLQETRVAPEETGGVVHGTTIATNTIIEGKLVPTAFLTTEGLRDMLEIQRQMRPSLYDLHFKKPQPLVPRYLCFGVPERLDAHGKVLIPLDEDAVRRIAGQLKDEGVSYVAVCYLHSFRYPTHEKRTAEILQETIPGVEVSLSSDVAPEFREYPRASTTVINAGLRPIVGRYLRSIEDRLRGAGLSAELLVMQSNGGVLTFAAAREKPVFMVESGPAAGVIATSYFGEILGYKNLMSFDMGGTTAKTGLIQDGTPRITREYEVGLAASSTERGASGGGYPIRTPVIDLVEIGAGGGSIAWVDSGGALRVGPHSAGADPAPVCYSKGGTEPTVTDANAVLGRLDPEYFLGGEMPLDLKGARNAIQEKCAKPLGLDVIDVALGIIEIANTAMVNALRRISVQRGYDPREFVLVAFGGAGPMHANRLAAELEIPTTLIPMSPGITTAMGLLVTDLKHDFSTTFIKRSDQIDFGEINRCFSEMAEQGRKELELEGMRAQEITYHHQADLRYSGQSYELTIPLDPESFGPAQLDPLLAQFHEEHERAYGFNAPEEEVEFVTLRLTAVGNIAKPKLKKISQNGTSAASAQRTMRKVYFAETQGFVDSPIYDRYRFSAGTVVQGPCIVEELDSTTVIQPGYKATVDIYGNLLLEASSLADA